MQENDKNGEVELPQQVGDADLPLDLSHEPADFAEAKEMLRRARFAVSVPEMRAGKKEMSHDDKRERQSWLEMLDWVASAAKLPPKPGYERRAIYLCIEDECDAGGEYVAVYDITLDEIEQLRSLVAPSSAE